MTKTEFHNNIIDITRKLGQGLSGIVIHYMPEMQQYADELIEEGKIRKHEKNFSHLPVDTWYMPTNCYDVWQDELENNNNSALFFVRLYLGQEDLGLKYTPKEAVRSVDFMERYAQWLKLNEKQLEAMVNLVSVEETETVLYEKDIEFLKERSWYKNNLSIKDCLEKSLSFSFDEEIGLRKKLLALYKSDEDSCKTYSTEIAETEEWFESIPVANRMRSRINNWLSKQDSKVKIQSII